MTPETFRLAIFDCDGVLVDSEPITNRVFAAMLNELGLSVTLETMYENFVGKSMAQSLELLESMYGKPVPRSFVNEYRRRTLAALKAELRPVHGVATVLEELTIPYCVASSGSHEKMQMTLGIVELLPRFDDRLFSVEDVARGKPAPDVYLHAARAFGVPPAACAVIEDTPVGVTAGVAAGMTVFGYAALTQEERLIEAGARYVFRHMDELLELLPCAAPAA